MYVPIFAIVKIEAEIKQEQFESSFHKMAVNLLFTSSWMADKHLQFLKPFGISQQQYNVLRILRGQYPEPASISLLMDRMLDKNSNASRLVDKLLTKGLVERTVSSIDRRQKEVAITEKGLKLLTSIGAEFGTLMNSFTNLSETQAEELSDLLDLLRG